MEQTFIEHINRHSKLVQIFTTLPDGVIPNFKGTEELANGLNKLLTADL